jgi:hypothetical protein
MPRRLMLGILVVLAAAPPASAQAPFNLYTPVTRLATMFTDLFGPSGLVVDSLATLPGEQPHAAHFTSDFQFDFSQFSTAIVSQLVSVPLPSPGGGFTFEFDPSLGVFRRTTQGFGPILTDRVETIGARRVSVGFALQRFTYDRVEGMSLGAVPAVFTHDNAELLGGREDVVTTTNAIGVDVNQSTTFVTVGVTDRFDVSLAVPVVSTSLRITSDASIRRLGTTNELTHFYRQADGSTGDARVFTASGQATGLGDVMVRVKTALRRAPRSSLGVGADLSLPTGDEMNLLGTGAPGLQPFAIWSASFGPVAPHAVGSFRWNGSSVLAGNPSTGETAHFPNQAAYGAGLDVVMHPRVTLVFDVLGRYVIDAERLRAEAFQALDGRSTFPNIVFSRDSYHVVNGAIGLKGNVAGRLLLDVNLLFAVNAAGLRDKVTPLIGLEYSF